MSASISHSDQQLAQQLITFTEAGMPLVADPWGMDCRAPAAQC